MDEKMRDSDYMGMLPDGNLYVLLTNTTRKGCCYCTEADLRRMAIKQNTWR